ncbi:hypothetical protein NQZ79_g7957 [Umbelopsis isabellina]|nr:hypothetical protein NQZ79_g7957 [Umbelopsis isabellina]
MNSIFGERSYNKPFLITYVNTASFSLYLLPFLLKRKFLKKDSKESVIDRSSRPVCLVPTHHNDDNVSDETVMQDNRAPLSSADNQVEILSESSLLMASDEENDQVEHGVSYGSEQLDKLTIRETVKLSLTFCFIWFLANWSTNASLAYTTVGSSTILSSMSGIGAMCGIEKISSLKIAAVFISLIGVTLVSYADNSNSSGSPIDQPEHPHNPLLGDILALMGAFFYGCYTILLKVRIQDESRMDMSLFFGFVGAFNVVLLWPCFGILHILGIEKLELPGAGAIWGLIILNALIGTFLSDYLWLLAMLMTSPLVVTLGLSLTIPIALTGDFFYKHVVPNLQYAIGAILVIIGFLSVNMAALSEVDEAESHEGRQLVPQEDSFHPSLDIQQRSSAEHIPKSSESLHSNRSYQSLDQASPQ